MVPPGRLERIEDPPGGSFPGLESNLVATIDCLRLTPEANFGLTYRETSGGRLIPGTSVSVMRSATVIVEVRRIPSDKP